MIVGCKLDGISLGDADPEILFSFSTDSYATVSRRGCHYTCPLYRSDEEISGEAIIRCRKTLNSYKSSWVEFVGVVRSKGSELGSVFDTKNVFIRIKKELSSHVSDDQIRIGFHFNLSENVYESFVGNHFHVEYFINFVLRRKDGSDMKWKQKLWINNFSIEKVDSKMLNTISLKIDSEFLTMKLFGVKETYFIDEIISCTLEIEFIRMVIRSIEIRLLQNESINDIDRKSVVIKKEIVEGQHIMKGDVFNCSLNLALLKNLSQTMLNIIGALSVRYHLELVIIDRFYREIKDIKEIVVLRR